MTLDKILEQWEQDAEIKTNDLDNASLETPKLHAKYIRLLTQAKLKLKSAQLDQKVLLRDKWLWYNGKMSQQRMEELDWDYDPLDGLKVMKGDMNYYYDSDPDIQKSEQKIIYYKTMVETLPDIVDNIKWRHQTIRNIINWRQFVDGS